MYSPWKASTVENGYEIYANEVNQNHDFTIRMYIVNRGTCNVGRSHICPQSLVLWKECCSFGEGFEQNEYEERNGCPSNYLDNKEANWCLITLKSFDPICFTV